MVDRGNCKFIEKARNIQNAGGKVALIVNNNDADPTSVIMRDDGTGSDIMIPLVLISKKDGEILKEYYNNNKKNPDALRKLVLDVDFQIEHSGNTAKVEVFMNSDSVEVYKLVQSLSKYDELRKYYFIILFLVQYVNYTPYYLTFPKVDFDDKIAPENRKPDPNCLGGGKYCARPYYSYEKLSPIEVVKENLLQKCIWQYSNTTNTMYKYFGYLNYFYENCYKAKDDEGNQEFTVECGKAQMTRTQLPVKEIEKCYADSFTLPEKAVSNELVNYETILNNKIFDSDLDMKKQMNVRLMPAIFINGKQFWGTYEKKAILEAICSGILKKPDICFKEGGFVLNNSIKVRTFWKIALLVVLLVIGISLIIFIACRKYMTQSVADKISDSDIDLKVNTVVTSYLALKDRV
jgi:hypothetical protein